MNHNQIAALAAKMTKASQDTAQRDIADLMRRGALSKNAEGGRSTSYSLVTEWRRPQVPRRR